MYVIVNAIDLPLSYSYFFIYYYSISCSSQSISKIKAVFIFYDDAFICELYFHCSWLRWSWFSLTLCTKKEQQPYNGISVYNSVVKDEFCSLVKHFQPVFNLNSRNCKMLCNKIKLEYSNYSLKTCLQKKQKLFNERFFSLNTESHFLRLIIFCFGFFL